jgi:hypothetical protein
MPLLGAQAGAEDGVLPGTDHVVSIHRRSPFPGPACRLGPEPAPKLSSIGGEGNRDAAGWEDGQPDGRVRRRRLLERRAEIDRPAAGLYPPRRRPAMIIPDGEIKNPDKKDILTD